MVTGDEKVEAIARAAGLNPLVPVVRSIVDPAFAQLLAGARDRAAVMGWYTAVASAPGAHADDLMDPVRRGPFIWTAGEFLAALQEGEDHKRRRADAKNDSRKRARAR